MVVTELSTGSSASPWAFLAASSPCQSLLPFVAEADQQQGWIPPSVAQAKLLQETIQCLKAKAAEAFAPIDATTVCPKRETYSDGGLFGASCNYEFGLHGLQGRRPKCEDYVLHLPLGPDLFEPFDDCTRACLACVLDGHGGTGAVQYVAERFPLYLLEDLAWLRREPAAAMRAALHRVDEELTSLGHNSGTTVNAILLLDDHVTVINTGDCRCIIYDWMEERTVYVTHDHNLRSSQERERVRAAGAEVSPCGDYVVLPCPTEGAKLLGVTKALGHAGVKALQRSATASSLCGSGSGSILGTMSSPPREPSLLLSPGAVAAATAGVEGLHAPCVRSRPSGSGVSSTGMLGFAPALAGGVGIGARPPFSLTGMSLASAAAAVQAGPHLLLPAMCGAGGGACGGCGTGVLADSGSGSASGMSEDEPVHAPIATPLASIDSDGDAETGCCSQQPQEHRPPSSHTVGCSGRSAASARALLPPIGRHPSARSAHFCPSVNFGRHSVDAPRVSSFAAAAHAQPQPHAAASHPSSDPTLLASPASASGVPSGGCDGAVELTRGSVSGSSFLLTCEPDVFEWSVQDDRHLILLACDGVFDAMGNSEVCTTVLRQLAESNSCLDAARKVTDRALKKESLDNITALVLRLGRKRIQRRKSMSVLNLRRCASNASGEMAAVSSPAAGNCAGSDANGNGCAGANGASETAR